MAVKLGEKLKYESLGTVEFLVGGDKKFYFLEVNPRLQVEHPVTEAITGIDLIKEQIKVASGEKLELKQKDINFSNWAMEFRIYAEDASNNFQPQEGLITDYLPPGGKGVEVHSFCQPGQKIFSHFDCLIAKLVISAKNRKECLQRAKRALDEYIIEGVSTLIPFFKVLIENQNFLEGNFSTAFIEKEKLIDILKEKYPEGKARKITTEEKNEEDLAKTIAQFYLESKKEEDKEAETDKWRLSGRIQPAPKFNRDSSWKYSGIE